MKSQNNECVELRSSSKHDPSGSKYTVWASQLPCLPRSLVFLLTPLQPGLRFYSNEIPRPGGWSYGVGIQEEGKDNEKLGGIRRYVDE